MFSNKSRKIDLSFLNYLTEDDVNSKQITIEEIKKEYPYLAKSNLECFKLFLIYNQKILSDNEKQEIQKTINYLQEQEVLKFKLAFEYIECLQNQPKSNQD